MERGGMNDDYSGDHQEHNVLFNTQEAEIVGIIVGELGCEAHQVTRHATFESLGADSLDMVELTMTFEDRYRIEISDEESAACVKVQDVFDVIAKAKAHEADATIRPIA